MHGANILTHRQVESERRACVRRATRLLRHSLAAGR